MNNKCILCTFFKMVWNGLVNNACPSIDKKKDETQKEKKQTLKIIGEFLMIATITIVLVVLTFFVGYWVLFLLAYVLGITIEMVLLYVAVYIAFPIYVIVMIENFSTFLNIRITCIKAYWKKAKEECE